MKSPRLDWPYDGSPQKSDQKPESGTWRRSDGSTVKMSEMNPYHRAAAIKKAEKAGDDALAEALRASGPLPD
ncbi:hypothetical protein [Paracoccus alkanivorans]|uniref:Uncharacterized protein n=1 Tax=Paracoccus alkanivorans TaxID=2116655 RepID=A0A3M0M7N9_9RHOB|nr:hypothetical protein [Paracoccus alkanivorans]RMC33736.1 hypothetical protein C9E81_15645 [Paracoccus alkanivorans]